MPEPSGHGAFVAAWAERATDACSQPQLIELLELALNRLYTSAGTLLGEVTLAAIVDRVLFKASERHSFLANVTLEASKISCKKLQALAEAPDEDALKDGLRFVMTEFLSVLGKLTAEILTPGFHDELSKLDKPAPHAHSDLSRPRGEPKDK
jgi:hypothetical protein